MRYVITNRGDDVQTEHNGNSITRIAQNAQNLLCTRSCEIPYDRNCGISTELDDLPLCRFMEEIESEVSRVLEWEPRCALESCSAQPDGDRMIISAVISVDEEDEEEDNG